MTGWSGLPENLYEEFPMNENILQFFNYSGRANICLCTVPIT